jgi:hypothetical protein
MPSPSMPAVGVHSSAIACGMISTKGYGIEGCLVCICSVTSLSVGWWLGWRRREKDEVVLLPVYINFRLRRTSARTKNKVDSVDQPDQRQVPGQRTSRNSAVMIIRLQRWRLDTSALHRYYIFWERKHSMLQIGPDWSALESVAASINYGERKKKTQR